MKYVNCPYKQVDATKLLGELKTALASHGIASWESGPIGNFVAVDGRLLVRVPVQSPDEVVQAVVAAHAPEQEKTDAQIRAEQAQALMSELSPLLLLIRASLEMCFRSIVETRERVNALAAESGTPLPALVNRTWEEAQAAVAQLARIRSGSAP